MIDLTHASTASSFRQTAPRDPGTAWVTDGVAIDAPPDSDVNPAPDSQWPAEMERSGLCGAVSPRVVALPGGGFRMYYTQILPRAGFPQEAIDYDNATSCILSATSPDGVTWTPESGVRLSPRQGGAGEFRVVSSEVVSLADGSGRLRMYFECCAGPQSQQNSIRSAVSDDGLEWNVESGARFELNGLNVSAPRIQILSNGNCRLYCALRGSGIISAISDDGKTFQRERRIRVAANGECSCPFCETGAV